jgi:hypothetical protein
MSIKVNNKICDYDLIGFINHRSGFNLAATFDSRGSINMTFNRQRSKEIYELAEDKCRDFKMS